MKEWIMDEKYSARKGREKNGKNQKERWNKIGVLLEVRTVD